jgi:hypothetical protein
MNEFAICKKCEKEIEFKSGTIEDKVKELDKINMEDKCPIMFVHSWRIGSKPWARYEQCGKIPDIPIDVENGRIFCNHCRPGKVIQFVTQEAITVD